MNHNQKGMSLIQVIIAVGIMGVLMMAMLDLLSNQKKEIRGIEQKQEALDLKNILLQNFTDPAICTWQLLDKTFDATNITTTTTDANVSVNLPTLYQGQNTSSAVLASSTAGNNILPSSLTGIRVSSIKFKSIFATGIADEYKGVIEIDFNPTSLVRAMKPVQVTKVIRVTPLASDPINARKITACVGGASAGGPAAPAAPMGYVRAHLNGVNPTANCNTLTKINYGNVTTNDAALFSAGRFLPSPGVWQFSATLNPLGITQYDNSAFAVVLYKNGVELARGPIFRNYMYGAGASLSTIASVVANDYFEFYAYYVNCLVGFTINGGITSTHAYMHKISD